MEKEEYLKRVSILIEYDKKYYDVVNVIGLSRKKLLLNLKIL